ncbi:MAG TPA: 4Fe-4S binding protein [Candidatus Krumholzibacteriaceae bacterium]|nr:4Fe-4S binding protein [Candidatus Krumholzibacteriaceae bacterium]
MDQILSIDKGAEEGVVRLLKFLLENDKVSGVFTLRRTTGKGFFDYALITDPGLLEDAIPLHPFMNVNGGKIISSLPPMKKPVAAVIRPCELRSFIELVKRSQGSIDDFLLISYTCGGSFPFDKTLKDNGRKLLPGYWKAVEKGVDPDNIRQSCASCEHFVPQNADITVSLLGEKDLSSKCLIYLHSERSTAMTEEFDAEISDGQLDMKRFEALLEKRSEQKEKDFKEIKIEDSGLDGMIDLFGRCIGCHGCMRVCPICQCVLCDFESCAYDPDTSVIANELPVRGGVRVPTDTVLFHIGRLSHMSFSCVGCGQCTEVCPADIPVSTLFRKTGEQVAGIFDYIPGRDVDEEIPVTIFKEDELSELGND